jgi:trehalose synthase
VKRRRLEGESGAAGAGDAASGARLEQVIGGARLERLLRAAGQFQRRLAARTIWNVSSTAVGGGVAEMLHVLTGYVADLGIPIGWKVITGDARFFAITKRLHNQIHGDRAGGPLTASDAGHYADMLAANAHELLGQIRPGDLVLLHDPQTAGLSTALANAGARVTWRCHIGVDWENDATRAAWSFLRPHLDAVDRYVFSRRQYVPAWVPGEKLAIIPPSIDPTSPKNQHLDEDTVRAILARIGVLDGAAPDGGTSFARTDGSAGEVARSAAITGEGRPRPRDPVVLQVSRWDRLKHPAIRPPGPEDFRRGGTAAARRLRAGRPARARGSCSHRRAVRRRSAPAPLRGIVQPADRLISGSGCVR